MRLGLFGEGFPGLSWEEFCASAAAWGARALEVNAGGLTPPPHMDRQALLGGAGARDAWLRPLRERGLALSALNCAANPIHPDPAVAVAHQRDLEESVRLAALLGCTVVVSMSGCPGDPASQGHDGAVPNFVSVNWPDDLPALRRWQWSEVALPYWTQAASRAAEQGVSIALELHPGMLAYRPLDLLEMRAQGAGVMANVDPSHFFWQGIDGLAATADLAGAIGHAHIKDTVIRDGSRGGRLDPDPPSAPEQRGWYFATPGDGQPLDWWRRWLDGLQAAGYDGDLSVECEDPTRSAEESARSTLREFATMLED